MKFFKIRSSITILEVAYMVRTFHEAQSKQIDPKGANCCGNIKVICTFFSKMNRNFKWLFLNESKLYIIYHKNPFRTG